MANEQLPAVIAAPVPAKAATAKAQTPQVVQLVVGKDDKPASSMGGLDFTASMVGSLAWPIVVMTFLIVFRQNIAKLLDRIKKAKIGSAVEVSLEDGAGQMEVLEAIAPPSRAEQAANAGMAMDEMPPALTQEAQQRTLQLNQLESSPLEPAEVVERIWRLVEQAVRQTARRKGVVANEIDKPVFILGKHMKGQEVFTAQLMGMLAELRKVRNLASNGEEVTRDASHRYFLLANRFINLLDSL